MRLFRIFRVGTTKEANERIKQAEIGLQSAEEAAKVSRRVVARSHAHAKENNFAFIIKKSLRNGYN